VNLGNGLHIRTDSGPGRRKLSATVVVFAGLDKGVTAKPERLTYHWHQNWQRVRLGFVQTFSLAREPDLKTWMIQSC